MLNVKVLRYELMRTLQRVYRGAGLYCEISSIKFDYDVADDDYENPFVEIAVRYGREEENGKNNFNDSFIIDADLKEIVDERQFFLGRCYAKFDE